MSISSPLQPIEPFNFALAETLHETLSEVIEKTRGDKDGRDIDRIEKGLTRVILREWNKRATKAVKSAVQQIDTRSSEPITKSDVEKISKAISAPFIGIGQTLSARVERDIKRIYVSNKRRYRNRFQISQVEKYLLFDGRILKLENVGDKLNLTTIKQESEAPLIRLTFNAADKETVSNLTRLKLLAIGDHFPKNRKPLIDAFIKESVFEQGLPKREAGEFLREELSKRLGGFSKAVPAGIRRQGQTAALNYFEGLSATTVTRARNFGQLNLLEEAGLTQFRWASIVDNRTSQICSAMDGRIFTVELGKKQMSDILSQTSSEGLINTVPWRRDLSEFGLAAGDRINSLDVSATLAQQGVPIIPPAHFRCRSEIVPA